MNLPTKNLKLGNSGISVVTSTGSRQAERNPLGIRFECMQHRVPLWSLLKGLITAGSTGFHLSKIGGFVTPRPCNMGQFSSIYFKNSQSIRKQSLYSISVARLNRYDFYTEYSLMIYIQPDQLKAFS